MSNSNTDFPLPQSRPRRLRRNSALRQLVRETQLSPDQLILPLFVKHGSQVRQAISSMPGQFQLSVDQLEKEINDIVAHDISNIILFGIPAHKDAQGSSSCDNEGVVPQAIRQIKEIAPELNIIADTCFCEYTDHGHCGLIDDSQFDVDNDATLPLLAQQAIVQAKAGADVIAPSGMMDGMVAAIRHGLDQHGFQHIPILSYAVKYASAFYGPFREAAEGAPQFGDRRSYQMDPANSQEALREALLDIQEGADMLMVKPALAYSDIICRVKSEYPDIPLGAYQVSGEYAMIKAASEKGWLDERACILETLTAIKRAGADFIITYFAKDVSKWL